MTDERNRPRGEDPLVNALFGISVVLGLVGYSLGFYMGARHDFVLIPAHAHLNLLGFVGLFMTALYYRGAREAAATRLARWQALFGVSGAVGMPVGMAAVILGGTAYEPVVAVGTTLAFVGMVLLAVVVFRGVRACLRISNRPQVVEDSM